MTEDKLMDGANGGGIVVIVSIHAQVTPVTGPLLS